MFEKALKGKLEAIFQVKVRFEQPSEAREQDVLFVTIDKVVPKISAGRQSARVEARALMFASTEALPFGYFAKQVQLNPEKLKDLSFFDLEQNQLLYNNIVERGFSFTYFFDGQYDPDVGTLTTLTFEEVVT